LAPPAAARVRGALGQFVEEGRDTRAPELRGGVVQRVHRRAEGLAAGQRAHRPADVLARAAHAGVFAVQRVVVVQVLRQPALHVAHRGRWRPASPVRQVVRDLAEDPRPALRGAADHQRVAAGVAQHLQGLLRLNRCRRWPPPGCAARPSRGHGVVLGQRPCSPARACGRAPPPWPRRRPFGARVPAQRIALGLSHQPVRIFSVTGTPCGAQAATTASTMRRPAVRPASAPSRPTCCTPSWPGSPC
jgi:hypothetical protein